MQAANAVATVVANNVLNVIKSALQKTNIIADNDLSEKGIAPEGFKEGKIQKKAITCLSTSY